jgi:hypothetical protein
MRRLLLLWASTAILGCNLALDFNRLQWPDAGVSADSGAGADAQVAPDAAALPPDAAALPPDAAALPPDAGLDCDAGPPAVVEDYVSTVLGFGKKVQPLANDSARCGEKLSVSAYDVTSDQGGTVLSDQVDSNILLYTPASNFTGNDFFHYTARDERGQQSTGMVRVSVDSMPPAPALWLYAGLGVTSSGSNVSAWADQSGHNNTAAQAETSRQPVFFPADTIAGTPAFLRFDGVDDNLDLGLQYIYAPAANLGMEFFFVVRSNETRSSTDLDDPVLFDFGYGAEKAVRVEYSQDKVGMYAPQTNGLGWPNTVSVPHDKGNAWVFLSAEVHFQDHLRIKLNGAVVAEASAATTTEITSAEIAAFPTRNTDGGPVTLGMQSKTPSEERRNLRGDVTEVLVYDRWLTQGQREYVECTLSMSYGKPLAYLCW